MPEESRLTKLIAQQIGIETDRAKRLAGLREKVSIAAARLLLLEMSLDSEKHAAILSEMLEILKGVPLGTSLWEHELEAYVDEALVRKEFEDGVGEETTALILLKEELRRTKDEGLTLLFHNIEEDQKKNNNTIQAIVKNLYKID
jgi:hypothetical protein